MKRPTRLAPWSAAAAVIVAFTLIIAIVSFRLGQPTPDLGLEF
ncbi:MAG: hypothetical protein Q4P06_07685 [Actinomycetaceae bacterium]|nr:hypothetical protein [Actinomycetaceae bacterium]